MNLSIYHRYKDGPEQLFEAPEGEVKVGRSKENTDLSLAPDGKVSRSHARFFYRVGSWWVEDAGSKHGTWLNGSQVEEATPLSPGDQLQLGDSVLRVEFELPYMDTDSDSGFIETHFPIDESQPAAVISEDKRIEILVSVAE